MKTTVRLGRIAGVAVGVHWSVLAIVVLLVGGLTVQLPAIAPGYPTAAYVAAAVLAAVLFVASLLGHELAHAVVARRNGVEVDGITLWLLGGVARLRGEAPTPGADFRISAVGPASSLLIAAGCYGLARVGALVEAGPLVVAVPTYLAVINVVLAVFNTIPAAPLDGGRILRSAVWAWRGDRFTATVVAARAGRIFGFTLIALGILQALSGAGLNGLWWVLLGLFVVTMANAEEQQARTTTALAGVRVGDVMTAEPETLDGDISVAEFVQHTALGRRHSSFPLLDDGRPAGLVTFNRVRAVPAEQRATTALRDIACPPEQVPTAHPDEALTALLGRLSAATDGRALVYAGGALVGIVSPSDISRAVALGGLGARFDDGS